MTVWLGTVSEFSTYFCFFLYVFTGGTSQSPWFFQIGQEVPTTQSKFTGTPLAKYFQLDDYCTLPFFFMVIVILYTHDCFNRTVLESTKLFTGCPHLLKFLLVMKEIIKDSYETAFQLLWRWFIFFPLFFLLLFFVLFCFFVPDPNNGMKSRSVYFIHVSLPWIQLHLFFSKVNSENIVNIIMLNWVNIQMQSPLSYMILW